MAIISQTSCGKYVFSRYGANLEVSDLALKIAISNLSLTPGISYYLSTLEMNSIIGHSIVVPTLNHEKVFYAKRPGNKHLSRFIQKEPLATTKVTLELKQLERVESEWLLVSSYLGEVRQPEINPDLDQSITTEQLDFWSSHAFCWGYVSVIPRTLTRVCPW